MENFNWMSPLLKKLRAKAGHREVVGVRESKRIEGILSHRRGIYGGKNVVIYIEKGLGEEADDISVMISKMIKRIAQFSKSKTRTYLFSFGWDDKKLHGIPRSLPATDNIDKWKKRIIDTAGVEPLSEPSVVHKLYRKTGASNSPGTGSYDVNIFFCGNKQVSISESSRKFYGKLMKRSVWIFLGDENDEPPAWNFGLFRPEQDSPIDIETT